MEIFNRLFTEFFKLKTKRVYTMLLVQLVGAVAVVLLSFVDRGPDRIYAASTPVASFFSGVLITFYGLSFVFTYAFFMLTCVENERFNRSQTLRLTPISDGYYYIDNILSSFVVMFYYIILTVLTATVLTGINYLVNDSFRQDMQHVFNTIKNSEAIPSEAFANLLGILMLVILATFLVYFLISFLNFSSRAILDFLPGTSSQAALRAIRFILIILIAWILIKSADFVIPIISSPLQFLLGTGHNNGQNIGLSIIIMLAIDLLFLFVNIFLISNLFEAHEKQ